MKKRFLATILVLCMALGMLPGTAWAADDAENIPIITGELLGDVKEPDRNESEVPDEGVLRGELPTEEPTVPEGSFKPEEPSELEATSFPEGTLGCEGDDIPHVTPYEPVEGNIDPDQLVAMYEVPYTASEQAGEIVRYSVLVLDTSATSSFEENGRVFYTADTAIDYVKASAKKFVNDVRKASGINYVAVVEYKSTVSNIVSGFTTDYDTLIQTIDRLRSSGTTRSVAYGLQKVNSLLNAIPDLDATKNVVLFTTGMTNEGSYSYSGRYNEDTVASNWRRIDTQVRLYAYSNSAIAAAETLKDKATLYSVGLFQVMEDMPQAGREVVEFLKLFTKDMATSEDCFYDVKDPSQLEFVFGEIADDVTNNLDTDGDGLYDIWEINGVDTDGDGVIDLHLERMGADPNVPDIFIEVDWMVRPEKKFLWFTTKSEKSYAPSQDALRLVYSAFKEHGINLHIDAGPNSVDFVTGNTWGNLSGGNSIPFEEVFTLSSNGTEFDHWNECADTHFTKNRWNAFRYAMFINQYKVSTNDRDEDSTSSGIASDIPGQCLIIANQQWLQDTGNIGVGGTFMHELGHTLGLSHGGFDHSGTNNHTNYKPNYLSIMNYLFQTSGLVGTNKLNYSDYTLPDLDEQALYEVSGFDPLGITNGSGIGTRISASNTMINPVAGTMVDFDNSGSIEISRPVKANLNGDKDENRNDIYSILTGTEDWSHITYKSGTIGIKNQNQVIHFAGITSLPESFDEELTLEEALENNVLANEGTGALEAIGPYTVSTTDSTPVVYVRVKNLYNDEAAFNLTIDESALTDAATIPVTVPASLNDISYVDVPITLLTGQEEGHYAIRATLTSAQFKVEINIPVSLYTVTKDDLIELENQIDDLKMELPDVVLDEYLKLLDGSASGQPGDLNGDGKVTMADVIRLARGAAGYVTLTKQEQTAGDVNGDGKITMADVIRVARFAAGYSTTL